jgi:chemotaxis protein methyltransferase CheR
MCCKPSQVFKYLGKLLCFKHWPCIKSPQKSISQLLIILLLSIPLAASAEDIPKIQLTAEEQAWLAEDHNIRVTFSEHPPYFTFKSGKVAGIAVELLDTISRTTGIKFQIANEPYLFADELKGLVEHSGPDIITAIMPTLEREKVILFTKPFINSPRFIFTRDDAPFVSQINQLFGKKVSVIKDYVTHKYLLENYPEIDLMVFDTKEKALRAVSLGKAFAFIGDLTSTPVAINQFGLQNLKAASPSGLPDHPLAMGIRNDWPELRDILEKALDAIPAEEKAAIINKWSTFRVEYGISSDDVLKWSLLIFLSTSGIVLMFLFWNKQLSGKVIERTSELKESEARFRATFEQAAVGVAHVSPDGKFLRVNSKFCEIVGYSEAEMQNLTFQDITHPDDLDSDLEFVQQVLKGERENYTMDKRYFHKDGSAIWINLTVSLVLDREDTPQYFVSVIKDISDRKAAEESLQQSYDFQEHLNTSVPDAIFSIRMPERVVEWINDSYNILGYEPEECVGKSTEMFYASPAGYRETGALLSDAIEAKKNVLLTEVILQRKNGEVFPAEVNVSVYRENGKVVSVTALARDISERKQAEEELRKSHDFLEHLTSAVPDAIFAVKMPERTIIWVNDSFNILGYDNEEYIGRSTSDFYANTEDHEKVGILQQEALLKGENMIRTEIMVRRKDGSVFPAELVATFYREEGELSQVTAMVRDISERKKAETEIKKSYEEIKKLQKQLQAESVYLQEEIRLEHNFENIIGNSNAIQYALFKVEQVAETDSTVLILGETGTGKELIARAIHHNSQRKNRPLIKINCATLPVNLIESELFGHEKGSFTGAVAKHTGRFEVADGSTLFLDEIGELPIELQAKLLRVIEDGEFERLGSTKTIKVDVRLITATNRDLEKDVSEGRFREDLWYRLNVFPITLPPLRKRTDDIPLIAQYYLDLFTRKLGKNIDSIPVKVMKTLQSYNWPGNVRELQNVLERAVISTSGNKLQLTETFSRSRSDQVQHDEGLKSLHDMERDYIVSVLDKTGWKISGNKSAAEILGLKRSTLRARMEKLGIHKS